MNKYKNKTLYRLNPIKATVSDFSLCVWCFNNIKGIIHPKIKNSVIFIASFTHSKVVLNLNEFHSSAKHKVSFEECGKPNSCWSTVTSIVFFSYYQSQCGPSTV